MLQIHLKHICDALIIEVFIWYFWAWAAPVAENGTWLLVVDTLHVESLVSNSINDNGPPMRKSYEPGNVNQLLNFCLHYVMIDLFK